MKIIMITDIVGAALRSTSHDEKAGFPVSAEERSGQGRWMPPGGTWDSLVCQVPF